MRTQEGGQKGEKATQRCVTKVATGAPLSLRPSRNHRKQSTVFCRPLVQCVPTGIHVPTRAGHACVSAALCPGSHIDLRETPE